MQKGPYTLTASGKLKTLSWLAGIACLLPPPPSLPCLVLPCLVLFHAARAMHTYVRVLAPERDRAAESREEKDEGAPT